MNDSRGWRRRLWLVCAVLVMTTFATGVAVIWQLHQTALAGSQRELNNMGIILAEQTSRAIQSVDLMLSEVQRHTITLGAHSPEQFSSKLLGETVRQFLSSQLRNLPQADTIALVDSSGALLNWSRDEPIQAADFPDQNYFRQMSINEESGTLIFAPGDVRNVAKWPMFMGRLIIGPGGTHLGLVVAQINTRYLEEFYRTISMLPGESVTVLLHDGLAVAGFPKIANRRGKHLPEGSPWYDRVAEGGGSYRSPTYLGGAPTTITVHPLRDYPLVVDVNVSEYEALENWREWTAGIVAATIAVALGLTVLFGMIAAQFGRQEDQNARLNRGAKALRESERKLKAYAEMSVDWFWEQDADLRFVRDAHIPLTSRPTDIGKTRWDIADDAMNPHRWSQHKAALAARCSFRDFRWERIQTDGKRRYMSTSGDPIFDEAGVFLGYHGTGRDITAEVAVKDRAEQAETLLRDAVDSMSEGFAIYDRDDCFVMCNETYRQIYAEGNDFLVPGANYEDILRHVLIDGGSPDSLGREEDWIADRLRHHQQADGATEHRPRNGSWILATDRRMKNGGIAGLRVDITELKHSQAALHESEAGLDRAQEIAGIGSWEMDVSTGAATWSKELYRIRGISPNDIEPDVESTTPFIHPDDRLAARRWITDLAAGLEQGVRETRNIRPNGEVRLLRVEGRGIRDPDGVIRRLAGTMQDITERRLIEQQLAQSQKMEAIGNLTGGMAHDFNNGLGVIVGNLDLLGRLIKTNPAATELCDEARQGAFRCADLIKLLLAFARRQPLRPRQIDVNELTESTARVLNRTLGGDITLRLHLGTGLSLVVADAGQVEAMLTNLANNARDAMPRGGNLDITTKMVELDTHYAALHPDVRPGVYVLIEVSDSGTGIAPEIVGNIFEPFFTTKEQGQGTGLGLSMVFGFVGQSGGNMEVCSEMGFGTTFRIYLPRAPVDETEVVIMAA